MIVSSYLDQRPEPCRRIHMPIRRSVESKSKPGNATNGWGGRVRTSEWRNQNPLPYHLATPQRPQARRSVARRPSRSGGTINTASRRRKHRWRDDPGPTLGPPRNSKPPFGSRSAIDPARSATGAPTPNASRSLDRFKLTSRPTPPVRLQHALPRISPP